MDPVIAIKVLAKATFLFGQDTSVKRPWVRGFQTHCWEEKIHQSVIPFFCGDVPLKERKKEEGKMKGLRTLVTLSQARDQVALGQKERLFCHMASPANSHWPPLMEKRQRGEPKMQAREGAREFLVGDTSESDPPRYRWSKLSLLCGALLQSPFSISDLSQAVPGQQQGKANYSSHRHTFHMVPGERAISPSTWCWSKEFQLG